MERLDGPLPEEVVAVGNVVALARVNKFGPVVEFPIPIVDKQDMIPYLHFLLLYMMLSAILRKTKARTTTCRPGLGTACLESGKRY